MIRYLACAAVAAALPLTAAAQYKCTDSAGKVAFQQAPCAVGAQSRKLDIAPAPPPNPAEAQFASETLRRQVAEADWRTTVARAIDNHYPIVGMTVDELVRAIGYPRSINTADYGRGFEEQRIYVGALRTWYVYTRNGVVTAIQDLAGGDPRLLTARRYCESQQEIDDEKTHLSSRFIDPADRERGEARIARWRRECL